METKELLTRPKASSSRFRHDYRKFYTYTIYKKASDATEKFVIRQFEIEAGSEPVPGLGFVCDSLYEARELLPSSLFNVGRTPNDAPAIVETWI